MNELVKLRKRISRDGQAFSYMLDYLDENGKRRRLSLNHADRRKAETERAQKEREITMGILSPAPMRLSVFLQDSLDRTGSQIRESTQSERRAAMMDFIGVVSDIDYQRVTMRHGELYRQSCLDRGNRPATVGKKLRQLKRLFQLGVNRKQLDENPFRLIELPKSPRRKVRVFSADESDRILRVAQTCLQKNDVRWDLVIAVGLTTAARRSEIFNAIWRDFDFEKLTFDVSPKDNTVETWQWLVKDNEYRSLPLTEEIIALLAEHQSRQPEGYPYVFVPPQRYDRIQELRKQGKWSLIDARLKIIHNFDRDFKRILKAANIKSGRFHDLRSTALTNWLSAGLGEFDIMRLAGHSDFKTTHQFYLSVSDDLVSRARRASGNFGARWARATLRRDKNRVFE